MGIPDNENLQISREVSQKFEFYLLALVFTILGFSIQTAAFTNNSVQFIFEIIALSALLLSGLSGLSRIEWISVVYKHYGYRQQDERDLNLIEQGLQGQHISNSSGGIWSPDELTEEKQELEKIISARKDTSTKVEKWLKVKYKTHKWSFVIGIICLLVSRILYNLTKLNL